MRLYNPGTKDLLLHLRSGEDLTLRSREVTPLDDGERENDQLRGWLVSGAVELERVNEEGQTDG
jgi:hypothetical protein